MSLISWLALVGVCAAGAMSPGPSLAVILQNRVRRSLGDALIASWSHAAGIFFWALAASTVLGTLFRSVPATKTLLTIAGALFLIYLAIMSWNGGGEYQPGKAKLPAAWLSGLSISLLNPKIFVFFTALFTQFIPAEANTPTLFGFAATAFLIDGVWYSLVSLSVGLMGIESAINRRGLLLNRIAAAFYLTIAVFSLARLTG